MTPSAAPRHPSPEAIRHMVRVIRELADTHHILLNLIDADVHHTVCGTVACLAGHFTLATQIERISLSTGKARYTDTHQLVIYPDTGDSLARHLGMEDLYDLQRWARNNFDLWGRPYGEHLLVGIVAYTDRQPAKLEDHLDIVLDHWLQVADRIEARLAAP